jgi:hypothetical protein
MNAQDIINAAHAQVAIDALSQSEKVVNKAIADFDFQTVFIKNRKPETLFMVMVDSSLDLSEVEKLTQQKLTSMGYNVTKIGVALFNIKNPAKDILGL